MPQPNVLILRAPGTNCDEETAFAFEHAGGKPQRLHVNRVLEKPALLADFQVLCIPGGFSYGDDLGAGKILASQIQLRLREAIGQFVATGKLVLGICNGFQVLLKSGILLPGDEAGPAATLTWNESGTFQDRWVRLRCEDSRCVFFAGIQEMYLPIAHAEGKFVARDAATIQRLAAAGQAPLRYVDNPNGSQADVAGVCDATGRVCGLMPHPERHVDPTQHPRWTRAKELPPEGDGLAVFRNAVRYFA
jgi:phosphoribosylformylglycinamidine synthase I